MRIIAFLLASLVLAGPALAQSRLQGQRLGDGTTGSADNLTLTPNGATTARPLKERARDVGYSVLDFGPSVGTGGDDSAAINAAILAASRSSGPNAGVVLFPYPPSGAYNVCADSVRVPADESTIASLRLVGTSAGGAPIRTRPGCTNPAALYATVYVQGFTYNNPVKSQVKLTFENLRIDGYCLSRYSMAVEYAVGLTLRNSVLRNAKAGNGANFFQNLGYETHIDASNRLENINDPGHTCYSAKADLPDYNYWTSATDSKICPVAVNARVANFYQANGGNNNFSIAHGWGYAPGNLDGQSDLRPQYTFLLNGKFTAIGAVADSPAVAGFRITNTNNDNSGATLMGSQVFGPMPAGTKGISIAAEVRNTIAVYNNVVGVPSPETNGVSADGTLDPSNTVEKNKGYN